MVICIKLSEQEKLIAVNYAKSHSLSLEEAFKQALFNKIEDEYDIAIATEAHKEYVNSGNRSLPISKLWKDLDLL